MVKSFWLFDLFFEEEEIIMPKLVRRARKSTRERRINACLKDLNSNLEKVELKAFRAQKTMRDRRRTNSGQRLASIPDSVRRGVMTRELYEVECRLHAEAGIPPPPTTEFGPRSENVGGQNRIGFVTFGEIARAVRRRPGAFARKG